jgi:hypothetical protein
MADNTAAKGFVMTPEDEEFNRVEMESRIKQENVRSMLAHPEQKPVAWMSKDADIVYTSVQVDGCFQHDHIPLYTVPPQRTWVGLTDEEIADCAEKMEASDPTDSFWREFFRGIEAKLKEKNT